MDGFEHIAAQIVSDHKGVSSGSGASQNDSTTDKEFLARVEQWHEEALRHPDHRIACVGRLNSGTARILHRQERAIENLIQSCKTNILEERPIQSAIATHTGLFRQFHSSMNFQVRLEKIFREQSDEQDKSDPLIRTAR